LGRGALTGAADGLEAEGLAALTWVVAQVVEFKHELKLQTAILKAISQGKQVK
jgi:hypothetical protein